MADAKETSKKEVRSPKREAPQQSEEARSKSESDSKGSTEGKEYTIPLRKAWLKKANYRRTGIAVKAIKQYIAKHMKVPDRDTNKVKIDPFFNNEMWFRGRAKPPARVTVVAEKDGDNIRVTFAETPKHAEYAKAQHDKRHKPAEQPKAPVKPTEEEKPAEEEQKEEKEKSQSAAAQKETQAKSQAKTDKHVAKQAPGQIQRKALRK
ncbi:hypothetical protein CMI48_02665 [Candidatus Pacearchaeota archaeon]|nr:hypothetical protein [Candidatus Pacearchaeota archaeon]